MVVPTNKLYNTTKLYMIFLLKIEKVQIIKIIADVTNYSRVL